MKIACCDTRKNKGRYERFWGERGGIEKMKMYSEYCSICDRSDKQALRQLQEKGERCRVSGRNKNWYAQDVPKSYEMHPSCPKLNSWGRLRAFNVRNFLLNDTTNGEGVCSVPCFLCEKWWQGMLHMTYVMFSVCCECLVIAFSCHETNHLLCSKRKLL